MTPEPSCIHVGFSGGLDSTVLLHLLHHWCQQSSASPPLQAIHVNHQLQPQADQWQDQCARLCQQWGIDCVTQAVTVDASGSSLEQQARTARYRVFRNHVKPGAVLMLAHHRDDQVETLLQRLARGSGPLGLGAMQACNQLHGMTILRPLLDVDRRQLEGYARANGLNWVDDPSNQDETIERNFIRRQLLPLWRSERPQLNQTLARSARLGRESAALLDDLAEMDCGTRRDDAGLAVERLIPLGAARRNNLLRFWLRQCGIQPPSEVILQRLVEEVALAAVDAQPRVDWGDCSVRRFQGVLYGLNQKLPECAPGHFCHLGLDDELLLPHGHWLPAGGAVGFSRFALRGKTLSIGFRQGGERLQLSARVTKSLKDLFQEATVAPWWRGLWPILYADGEIVGLPGLWVCERYTPRSPDDEIRFLWQQPGAAQD